MISYYTNLRLIRTFYAVKRKTRRQFKYRLHTSRNCSSYDEDPQYRGGISQPVPQQRLGAGGDLSYTTHPVLSLGGSWIDFANTPPPPPPPPHPRGQKQEKHCVNRTFAMSTTHAGGNNLETVYIGRHHQHHFEIHQCCIKSCNGCFLDVRCVFEKCVGVGNVKLLTVSIFFDNLTFWLNT